MADRTVESYTKEIPDIPEELERVLVYILNEARDKVAAGEELTPFTALAIKDKLFIESHPADTIERCFAAAEHTVHQANGADAYGFCYDGYVEVDDRTLDAVIAEGGIPGGSSGHAIGYVYEVDSAGAVSFESEPTYIGTAPNFMIRASAHAWPVEDVESADETPDQTEGAPGAEE